MSAQFNVQAFVSDIAQAGAPVIEARKDAQWYPCGSSWVRMSARGKIAKALVENKLAYKAYGGGLRVSCASIAGYRGQSMETSKAICEASLAVFEKHGIKTDYIDTWID